MAAYGVPEADIARVIGIDPKTLRKHYRGELDIGAHQGQQPDRREPLPQGAGGRRPVGHGGHLLAEDPGRLEGDQRPRGEP